MVLTSSQNERRAPSKNPLRMESEREMTEGQTKTELEKSEESLKAYKLRDVIALDRENGKEHSKTFYRSWKPITSWEFLRMVVIHKHIYLSTLLRQFTYAFI